MKRQAGPGLALLTIAKENAVAEDATWVSSLYNVAHEAATENDLAEMAQVIDKYRQYYGKLPKAQETNDSVPYPQRKEEEMPVLSSGTEKNVFQGTPTMSPPTTSPDDTLDK